MKKDDMKAGMVFRYNQSQTWCRHGLAVINEEWPGHLSACDTYWGMGDTGRVELKDLEEAEFIGNLKDYKKSHREECDRYNDDVVIYIPMGGGSEQWWLKIGAVTSPEKVRYQLNSSIEGATWKISSLECKIKQWKAELDALNTVKL